MKTIINFCPTGMVPTKKMTPHVPVTVSEIVEQIHEAFEIGITIVHIHARDDDGSPTYKSSVYRNIFEKLRTYCPGLILCGSTSGRKWSEFEKRIEVIDLKPDMCSLTLNSLNFLKQASLNAPEMVMRLAERMNENGVVHELEVFDFGSINYGKYLIHKGFQVKHIMSAISEIPDGHLKTCAGLGGNQLPANNIAIALGAGVRVGIEDSIFYDIKRQVLCTNTMLIKRIYSIMEMHERELMTSEECKKILKIQ